MILCPETDEKGRFPCGRNFVVREEILAAVQAMTPRPVRILSLGVGAGETEKAIREWCGAYVMGIELDERLAAIAKSKLDAVVQGDAESPEILQGRGEFDLIICADILEHLRDPQALLRTLRGALSVGGSIIISVPNARHWHLLYPLVVKGDWVYRDSGILDNTHLRFFTRKSLLRMIEGAGYTVRQVRPMFIMNASTAARTAIIKFIGLFVSREFVTFQFIVVATRTPNAPDGSPASQALTTGGSGRL
jgi:2-polyprenyl-3-methyl-5-hydroxy-6-metoxy-1,4-benzoquinol methylase